MLIIYSFDEFWDNDMVINFIIILRFLKEGIKYFLKNK